VGVKWPGHEADHLLLPSAKVKSMWSYASTAPYAFKACTGTISLLSLLSFQKFGYYMQSVYGKVY
jgi:hypothetical protein